MQYSGGLLPRGSGAAALLSFVKFVTGWRYGAMNLIVTSVNLIERYVRRD